MIKIRLATGAGGESAAFDPNFRRRRLSQHTTGGFFVFSPGIHSGSSGADNQLRIVGSGGILEDLPPGLYLRLRFRGEGPRASSICVLFENANFGSKF